ncbi:MAG: DNA-binding protein [Planctomycetota bacterium]
MAASTPMPRTHPPLLTKKQTAEFYSATTPSIDRWLLEGTLPTDTKVVIGSSVRLRTAVLMNRINRSTTATSEVC